MRYLLEQHFKMFVGVQKLVAVFEDDGDLHALVKNENSIDELHIESVKSQIDLLRTEKQTYAWFEESGLPFRVRQAGIFQKELFDELEKTILLIRIPNQDSDYYDLLFLYYDKNLSILGLNEKKTPRLSVDLKPIIAQQVYQTILSIIDDARRNKQVLKTTYNVGTQTIIESLKQSREELNQVKQKYNSIFSNFIIMLYHKHLNQFNCMVTLSDSAISKLLEFEGQAEHVELIVANSVQYIHSLYLGNWPDKLLIEDYHISLTISDIEPVSAQNRYSKTIALLDQLNMSVKKIMEQHHNPTGLLVGQYLDKPISAPAISDALKNHRTKILTLLEQYPDRWPELRRFFKPIQNLQLQTNRIKNTGTI